MKRQKITNYITWSAVTIAFGIFLFVVIKGFIIRKQEIDHIYSHTFNGKITKFRNLHRGNLEIWLDDPDTSFQIQSFAKYLDTLQVGDSLFKEEKSFVIYYYKRKPDSSFYLYDEFTVYSKVF